MNASTSLLRYASTAKSFVGVVAAFLAADGVIDLDLPITTYYPAYPTPTKYLVCSNGEPASSLYANGAYNSNCRTQRSISSAAPAITLRMLLGMRAGLQHYGNGIGNPVPPKYKINSPSWNTGMEWALGKRPVPHGLRSRPRSRPSPRPRSRSCPLSSPSPSPAPQ